MNRKDVSRALPVLVLLVLAAGPAHAEKPGEDALGRARSLYARGQGLFSQGSYREAMARFSEGYDLSRRPAFLFNMAECARLLGDRKAAHPLYVRYLSEDTRGRYRLEAIRRCEELQLGPCQPKPARMEHGSEAGARTAPKRTTPPPRVAPKRTVPKPRAVDPSAGRTKPGTADDGDRLSLKPPPPPKAKSKPFYKKWPLWVAVVAAVVAGSVTAAVLATRDSGSSAIQSGDHVVHVP